VLFLYFIKISLWVVGRSQTPSDPRAATQDFRVTRQRDRRRQGGQIQTNHASFAANESKTRVPRLSLRSSCQKHQSFRFQQSFLAKGNDAVERFGFHQPFAAIGSPRRKVCRGVFEFEVSYEPFEVSGERKKKKNGSRNKERRHVEPPVGRAGVMNLHEIIRKLHLRTDSKIVLLVADGLGGLPTWPGGPTELEAANTPHLDALAKEGTTGLLHPVTRGVTCGSGPGHLSLFGYDPTEYLVGRGVLSSLGIDFDLQAGDVAARGNFCSVDESGTVTDRRAGRIADAEGRRLAEKLQAIEVPGVELFIRHVKQYRFVSVFRGEDLGDNVSDTDPRSTGVRPRDPEPADDASESTCKAIGEFIRQAREILKDESPANMVLLRGFGRRPELPTLRDLYGLDSCAIAIYPMYRGLSRLLGMHVPEKAEKLGAQVGQMRQLWNEHDFFFFHHKSTDSSGEDGDFDGKVREIETLDRQLPAIRELDPDVLIVTGDHSTPASLANHSWHPVPVLLNSSTCRPDRTLCFGEREAIGGGLGQFPATELMALAMGHALKLDKFGA